MHDCGLECICQIPAALELIEERVDARLPQETLQFLGLLTYVACSCRHFALAEGASGTVLVLSAQFWCGGSTIVPCGCSNCTPCAATSSVLTAVLDAMGTHMARTEVLEQGITCTSYLLS
jgi:hypothetical protein